MLNGRPCRPHGNPGADGGESSSGTREGPAQRGRSRYNCFVGVARRAGMAGETADEPAKTIGAVESTFTIVEELEEAGAMGVSELAEAVDLPKSTVHVHLQTLTDAGYVRKDGRNYRLSLRFLEVGGRQRQRSKLYQAAKPEVDKLSRATGEVANLGIEEGGKRVLLYTAEEPGGIFDNAPVGEQTYMHWTSLGKAMLAFESDERVEEIVDRHGLPQATEHTITTRDALRTELEETRERGYSIEDEDRRDGVMAFATPIEDPETEVIGAVSVSGPRTRFAENEADLVEELQNAANIITLKHKHY